MRDEEAGSLSSPTLISQWLRSLLEVLTSRHFWYALHSGLALSHGLVVSLRQRDTGAPGQRLRSGLQSVVH